MFLNARQMINKGCVVFPSFLLLPEEKYIQPNAIDFTLDRAFIADAAPHPDNSFFLYEDKAKCRTTPDVTEIEGETLCIPAGSVVDCMSNFFVKIPEGAAAHLITRSTLNRNGMFITSGLYDSGFSNNIGFCLHNRSRQDAYIQRGCRVGQIVFSASDSEGTYNGQYNNQQNGKWWGEVNDNNT